MVNYILIAILIIFVLLLLRAKHVKEKIFLVLIILLIIFFVVTASTLIKNKEINLTTFDGIVVAGKIYFKWLIHIGKNLGDITGEAIKMDWKGNVSENFSYNISNSSK